MLQDDFDKYVTAPAAPKPPRQREFRTDRNNNPIAAAVTTGGKNQFTKALDDAEIEWEHGDPFPNDPKLSTIRIKGDPYEGARAILSNSNALKWYRGTTGKTILSKHKVRSNTDFANLPTEHQNDIINGIYQSEGGHGKLKPSDDDFDKYVDTQQATLTSDDFDKYVTGPATGRGAAYAANRFPRRQARPPATDNGPFAGVQSGVGTNIQSGARGETRSTGIGEAPGSPLRGVFQRPKDRNLTAQAELGIARPQIRPSTATSLKSDSDEQIKANIRSQVADELARSIPQGRAPRLVGPELDAEVEARFSQFKQGRALDVEYARTGPSMGARQLGLLERAKTAIAPYTPGLQNIDTPMGVKSDPIRGLARGLTLGAIGDKREITPEEKLVNPNAEADRDVAEFTGETIGGVVPYVAAGKLLSKVPALAQVGRVPAAIRTGATFGGVETAREGIHSVKTGEAFRPEEVAISTAIGAAMGAIPGINAGLKTRLLAAVAPQVVADVARGRTLEEAAQGAITNILFEASAGRKLGLSKERIGELREQIGKRTVPERPQAMQAQLDQRGFTLIPEGTSRPPLPRGTRTITTTDGTVYYDPKRVNAATIRATPTTELLGHVEPKSESTTAAVVARDADGREVHSSAVSPENVERQAAVTQANFPEAKVEVGGPELAADVIAERATPERFTSKVKPEWGEVVRLEDQSGADANRIKVHEAGDPSKIHYAKTIDLVPAEAPKDTLQSPASEPPVEVARPATSLPAGEQRVTDIGPPEGTPNKRITPLEGRFADKTETPEAQTLRGERDEADRRANEAETDGLTGLQSSSQWTRMKDRIGEASDREIAYLDLNELKNINDTHGHAAGDRYLTEVGKIVREEAAKLGITERQVARAGGDEIGIDAPLGKGQELVDAIKARVGEYREGDIQGSIAGGVGFEKNAADKAMYADKAAMKAAAKSTPESEAQPSIGKEVIQSSTVPLGLAKSVERGTGKTVSLNDPIPDDVASILHRTFNLTAGPSVPLSEFKGKTAQGLIETFADFGLSDEIILQSSSKLREAGYSRIGDVLITDEGLKLAPRQLGGEAVPPSTVLPVSSASEGRQAGTGTPVAAKPEYGSTNKLITHERADAARARLKAKLDPSRLKDIGDIASALPDLAELGAFHIEAGSRAFGQWSKRFLSEFDDKDRKVVEPHLKEIYERANEIETKAKASSSTQEGQVENKTPAAQAKRVGGDAEVPVRPVPETVTEDKFYETHKRGTEGVYEAGERLDKLSDDTPMYVFHATDKATAQRFISEGIDTSTKPSNLARARYERGEDAEFAPGRGLAAGITVAGTPNGASGYGRQLIAIRIRKGDLRVPPEQAALGVKSGAHALAAEDAHIEGKIKPSDVVLIGEAGRHPESAFKELRKAGVISDKPQGTSSIHNESTESLRRSLDQLEIEPPERKSFQQSIDNALEKGLDKKAESLADDVISGKESTFSDEQAAGVLHRMRELESRYEELHAANKSDPELAKIEATLDRLTQATKSAGTATARDLSFRRATVDQDFKLISMIRQAKEAKGRDLTPAERTRYESIVKERDTAIAARDKAVEQLASKRLQNELDRSSRQRARTDTKEKLDKEATDIKANIVAEFARLKAGREAGLYKSAGGLGALDPDGIITRNLLKYARNRAKAEIGLRAEKLIDDAHALVGDFGVTRRQVAEALSGYGKAAVDKRGEAAKRLADIRSEITRLLKADDIATGKSDTPALKRAKTVTKNRITELNQWITAGKRIIKDKSELIPDEELTALRAERDNLKEVFDALEADTGDKAISKALAAVERSIKINEGRLSSGNLDPSRKTSSPWSEELGQRQQVAMDLRRQLADARKAAEVKPDPQDARIEAALKAKQRAIDIERENLRTGRAANKGTPSSPWSPELGKLNQELNALRKQRTERDKVAAQPARDAARAQSALESRLRAAEKAVAATQAKIDNADTSAKARTPKPTTPEIESIRAQNRLLNDILRDMRSSERKATREAQIASGEITATQQGPKRDLVRNANRLKVLQRAEAEWERKLNERDFEPKSKGEPYPYNSDVRRAEDRVKIAEAKFRREMERARPGHMFRNASGILKAGWLSSPFTHLMNIGGTGALQVFREAARLPAAIADATWSSGRQALGMSAQRSIQGPLPSAMLESVFEGMGKKGLRDFVETMRHGATSEQMKRHQFEEIDFGSENRVAQTVQLAFNSVFRFMSASDRVFYQGAFRRNLIDRATIQAKNEGVSNVRERARELVDEAKDDIHHPLHVDAKADGMVATLNNDNVLSDKVKRFRSNVYNPKGLMSKRGAERANAAENFAIDFVLPFDRTPTNVVFRILEASPLGYGKNAAQLVAAAIRKTMPVEHQRQLMQTFGHATAGTALMALGWYMGDKARGLIEVDGQNVYLKIPGLPKLNLRTASPAGNILAGGARLRAIHDDPESTKGDYAKAILREPANQPLLRAAGGLSELITDPDRSAGKFFGKTASGLIPFSGAARFAGEIMDPAEKRYPDSSFKEQFQKNIPVSRETLPASRVRLLGSEVTKATKEAGRLKITIKGATKQEDETDVEFTKRQAITNGNIRTQIENVVALPEYDAASDTDKTKWLKQAASFASQQTRESLPERPEKPEERQFPMPQSKGVGFESAYPADALAKYERMSPTQRVTVRDSMQRKAQVLLNDPKLSDEQKADFKERLDKLGISATPRPRRSFREQFATP